MVKGDHNLKSSTLLDAFIKPVQNACLFIENLSEKEYCTSINGPFSSTIGQHMRHILDHYNALIYGVNNNLINYNLRTRNSSVESDMNLAKDNWEHIFNWVSNLDMKMIESSVDVVTEHTLVRSTFVRELSFVSSHADHHFAMMKLLAFSHGIFLPTDLGVAPATLKAQKTVLT